VTAIPYFGAGRLRAQARRARLVRIGLVVALVALLLVVALATRHPHSASPAALPVHSGDLLVLDLSASISQDTYSRIGETLRRIAATGGRYGLVVFSTDAYEALPPGTPASALAPYARYFTVSPPRAAGFAPTYPTNPWSAAFSGGTAISSGLALARTLIFQDHLRHASVVLVSDLADDPQDKEMLNAVMTDYRRDRVPLRVVPLNASPTDADYFARLTTTALGNAPGPSGSPTSPATPAATPRNHVPTALVVAIVAIALVLAALELAAARLRWSAA
jgi:hypothetical protein